MHYEIYSVPILMSERCISISSQWRASRWGGARVSPDPLEFPFHLASNYFVSFLFNKKIPRWIHYGKIVFFMNLAEGSRLKNRSASFERERSDNGGEKE